MNGIKILAVLAFTSASVDSAAGDKIKVHGNDLVVNSPPGGAVLINGVDVLKELDSIATAAGDTRAMTDPPTSRPERSLAPMLVWRPRSKCSGTIWWSTLRLVVRC